MSNKINTINSSSLLDNKLAVLFREYNELVKSDDVNQQEQLLLLFNELMNKFQNTLNNPLFNEGFSVKTGNIVDYQNLNNLLKTAQQDIEILYLESSSLHDAIIRNFNSLVSFGNKIKSKLRSIRSNVATYKLYSNNRDLHFISDSFNNYEYIEKLEDLYNAERCNINLNEGTVTLPINTGEIKEVQISIAEIGPSSNGSPGNNQEIGQLQRGSLKNFTDGNPGNWFEYELVKKNPIASPLILELRLTLEKEAIINNIEITPNSFAIRNFPKITTLSTSLDGNFFVDLINDIPISNEDLEGKDDFLILSPSSGKFSGISSFSFKPRRAKYIKLIIQQDENYLIKTPAGLQYRKAIGIRDILIKSIPYQESGELVSVRHQAVDEIKKLGLSLTSNTFNNLTSIASQVTYDDNTWLDITPLEESGDEEVINFNTIDNNSVNTTDPVNNIRYKAILKRNGNAFSGSDTVVKTQKDNSEFLSINPSTSSLVLSENPIVSSIGIYGVGYGRTGGEPLTILASDIIDHDTYTFIKLPNAFRGREIDSNSFKFLVNNEPWELVQSLSTSGATDKHYEFDAINNIIKAGNDINGMEPNGTFKVVFDREQLLFSFDSPRTATLNFFSDSIKNSFNLYKLDDQKTIIDQSLQKGSRILRLGKTDIKSITFPVSSVFLTEKTFVNGDYENTASGEYSIDYINGIIYTYDMTPENDELKVTFDYYPRTNIKDFDIKGNQLIIQSDSYSSSEIEETISLTNAYTIHLGNRFIEPKSLQFLTSSLLSNFIREVPYKGDGSEFRLELPTSELAGLYTVDYKNGTIITFSQITGNLKLKYRYTRIFSEYNIAREIPKVFTVNDNIVKFNEDFIVSEFGESIVGANPRNLFKVDYKFIEETHDNLKDLEKYYTPFLRDYTLRILPRSNF